MARVAEEERATGGRIVKLIGLVGLRRSGKDTAAAALVQKLGYVNVKFADPLKNMLRSFLNECGYDAVMIERMIEGDLKEEPAFAFGWKSTRHAMKTLGTEWGRDLIHQDVWVRAAIESAKQYRKVVISDVRFPNEAAAIKAAGGHIIKIVRNGLTVDSHPSESLIETLPFDVAISNGGTIQDLQEWVVIAEERL
jgi:hypothetical protein